jgi:hypothetical protein
MKAVHAMVLGAMMLAVSILPSAFSATADKPTAGRGDSLDRHATGPATAGTSIVREIDDPHSGDRWLLLIDPRHPAGPGRLVLADVARKKFPLSKADVQKTETPVPPVIHTGERLILEEHSSVVDSRLDAIALNPAAVGGALSVRLIIGGKVVRALAVAPGCVVLAREKDGRQ